MRRIKLEMMCFCTKLHRNGFQRAFKCWSDKRFGFFVDNSMHKMHENSTTGLMTIWFFCAIIQPSKLITRAAPKKSDSGQTSTMQLRLTRAGAYSREAN